MKFKRIMAGTLAVLMLTSLAGCGEKEVTTSTEKKKIVVTFDNGEIGSSKETAVNFEPFLKEHPEYELEVYSLSSSDPKMLAMMASGNAPDIIRLSAPTDIATYAARGMIIPLDDFIKKSDLIKEEDLYDTANLYRFDGKTIGSGKLYGLPKDWSINSQMWINKAMFEEAGIRIPTAEEPFSIEEWAEACKKLTKVNENGEIVQMGASIFPTSPQEFLNYVLSQTDEGFWNEDYSKTTMDSPKTREYFELFVDLQKNGYIESKLNEIDEYMWFSEGKLGMWFTGYWASAYFRDANNKDLTINKDDIILAPGPVVDKNNPKASIVTVTGGGISKDCKDPEAAFKVLEYIIAGQPARVRSEMGYGFPALKSLAQYLPDVTDMDKQAREITEVQSNCLVNEMSISPYVGAQSLAASFNKFYIPVLYGEDTLDNAIEQIENELRFLTQEGKEVAGE